ncbi:hypothetical protein KDA_50710 [Dictyobacter alpinus]|uniref:Uncharacterized protein n=1 Tax=Dictyobacter alpinus TaxID=2014873 RepID=A0A402BEA8_9CHLR|nr:hypothetical protein KDA_50710 [Dictyobacter alpinus]
MHERQDSQIKVQIHDISKIIFLALEGSLTMQLCEIAGSQDIEKLALEVPISVLRALH